MAKRKSEDAEAAYRSAEARIARALRSKKERFKLESRDLTELPPSIGQLTWLRELDLSRNQLRSVPETLDQLAKLQKLYLSDNELTSVPEALGQLTGLQKLYLARNQLTSVPETLGQLTQLRELDLSNNQLTSVPKTLGQLTGLQRLHLSRNQLTSVPETLGRLSQLQTLALSVNQLTSVPETLCQLTELQRLYLSRNQLTSVPEALGQLTQLRELFLSRNRLTSAPEALGQLGQLRTLHLANNHLTSVAVTLRELHNLEELYLHGNGELAIPKEVLGPTWGDVVRKQAKPARPSEILDYYFRIHAARRPLNEAKLILVGRGGVGKTSLVNRLLFDRFDQKEKKTEGIRISEWKLRLHDQKQVRLNLWDFGGQEIMHATHQFFLTQRSLYLLVLEGRQGGEDADADYWLKLIESFGAEGGDEVSPVLIALNKASLQRFDLDRRALQRKYPFIRGFVVTDCKDRTGIEELRTAIERETNALKHLRDAFPASWFAIKDRLAGMEDNFITLEQYRDLCAGEGEGDAKAQDSLASHLHNLGIALNYREDPRLWDTHVLNPHWVTTGIYTILNSRRLAEHKGELHLGEVERILDLDAYPRHMHRFLFDLMKKFELCFTFPDDDTHYLIPELLDKQEAEESAEFEGAACLHFEYQYSVLPEGLLPRFIVRTHALSTALPRWRTGVILSFEGNRAMVKADVQDKRVFIRVTGPAASRRRLLAVIRSDLERIHAHISKLRPEAFVPVPDHPELAIPYAKLLTFESNGVGTFHEAVGDDVVELDVQALLNGVDLEGTRRRQRPTETPGPVRLFYSYAHKDEALRNDLETHLKILERRNLIAPWHDRRIVAGEEWEGEIDANLERADIILLLVSADFIASNYCWNKEFKRALERHEAGEATVVPVIVRDVNWHGGPFAKLQALPKDARAVMEWPSQDAAWRNVSEGIERLLKKVRPDRR